MSVSSTLIKVRLFRLHRQARRHLERADFDALRDSGLLQCAVPVEAGGRWAGLASARPLCELYRGLAGADSSVTLVSAMHPAVISYWHLAAGDEQPLWEAQRAAVFASATAGEQWGTITSDATPRSTTSTSTSTGTTTTVVPSRPAGILKATLRTSDGGKGVGVSDMVFNPPIDAVTTTRLTWASEERG